MSRTRFSPAMRGCALLFVVNFCACVVPQHLEEDVAGSGSTPQFLPGPQPPASFTATQESVQAFTVGISDPDPQTLSVRMFLDGDYSRNIPFSSGASSQPWSGISRRTFDFDMNGLCDELIDFDLVQTHVLELYVSDTAFETEDPPDRRHPDANGKWNSLLWRYRCETAP